MFVVRTKRAEFGDFVIHAHRMLSHAQSLNPSRAGTLYGRMRTFSSDKDAHLRAPVKRKGFPACLRHRKACPRTQSCTRLEPRTLPIQPMSQPFTHWPTSTDAQRRSSRPAHTIPPSVCGGPCSTDVVVVGDGERDTLTRADTRKVPE